MSNNTTATFTANVKFDKEELHKTYTGTKATIGLLSVLSLIEDHISRGGKINSFTLNLDAGNDDFIHLTYSDQDSTATKE